VRKALIGQNRPFVANQTPCSATGRRRLLPERRLRGHNPIQLARLDRILRAISVPPGGHT